MRRLMLLRHAKAEPAQSGRSDIDRALAPNGRDAASRVGAYMAHHALLPDLVLCSLARRTRQTWELAAAAFSATPQVKYDERVYSLQADGLLDLLRAVAPGVHLLLMVGHNPAIEELAETLVASGEPGARERLANKVPTGALAVIDFNIDDWATLAPCSGRLDQFVTPKTLPSGEN
jgi:phosphohistidine phosphatase